MKESVYFGKILIPAKASFMLGLEDSAKYLPKSNRAEPLLTYIGSIAGRCLSHLSSNMVRVVQGRMGEGC